MQNARISSIYCQKLCKLYKFKRDETSHGEDILHATNLQFDYTTFKFISFTATYQMDFRYKNICICIGDWEPGIWRYSSWPTEDMLPEFSHANVSTLASEEIDNMLFHAGGFNP